MQKLCGHRSGLGRNGDRQSKSWKELVETDSFRLRLQIKDITVRIVHAGGKEELYECAISAAQLLRKYPGMHVARPAIFKQPHESLLTADDILLPGQKYYIIPSTTVAKLKRDHSSKATEKQHAETEEPKLDSEEVVDLGEDRLEESIYFAKDFYASKERWSDGFCKKSQQEKNPFVPPIRTPRTWKDKGWEPSLTSIEETSP